MVCSLVIIKFLAVTRNKELAGSENIVEISPFCICQFLVPPLSSKKQKVSGKFFLLNIWVCCYSGHTTPWPPLQAASSPLQSTHQQGLQTPVSRSWCLWGGFPLPLYLEYSVVSVSLPISPGELNRLMSSIEPNPVVEYFKVIFWTVTIFFKFPTTFTLDRSNLLKSRCNIHVLFRSLFGNQNLIYY